ncbi:hypothetical protein G7K_2047-t1 [Saitoella complicata NRRL Y-17804]|uniref:Zn(2)-C6 fungal-type domain-containing protein n=1 Tax=Saitoella complicata (strain BCRC 22490 / CBS 7301 / JCM 7358 / NBRC 10748 / NRRL Y-17804) TaxID=698492 RepID=A0A0E9NDP5_SAICN|nr:hypothetical protein G7K_2047-t1 [Saitoella complicata NRRL Y-17804]
MEGGGPSYNNYPSIEAEEEERRRQQQLQAPYSQRQQPPPSYSSPATAHQHPSQPPPPSVPPHPAQAMTPVHGPRRRSEGALAPVAVPAGYPLPPINPFHGVPHSLDEQRQWQQQQQHAPPHEARPPYNPQNPLEHRYPPPPPLPAQQIPGGMVQTAHTQSLTQRAAPRQRTAVACRYCRRRKIRCSGFLTSADGRCQNCIRLDQECVFTPVAANVADIHIAQHTPPSYQHPHPHQQGGYPPPPQMPQQGHLPHSRSMSSVYPGSGPGPENVTPQRGYYDNEYPQSPSTAPGPPPRHRGSASSGWSQPQPAPPSQPPPTETPIPLPVYAQHKIQRSHEYASSWPERTTPAGAPYPRRSYPSSPPRRVESPRGGGYAGHGSYGGAGEYSYAAGQGPERQQAQGNGGPGQGLYPPEYQWRQPSYGGHPTHQGSASPDPRAYASQPQHPLPPPATAPPASARREGEGPLALLSRAAERERYQTPNIERGIEATESSPSRPSQHPHRVRSPNASWPNIGLRFEFKSGLERGWGGTGT